jgi:hypothetical protein
MNDLEAKVGSIFVETGKHSADITTIKEQVSAIFSRLDKLTFWMLTTAVGITIGTIGGAIGIIITLVIKLG